MKATLTSQLSSGRRGRGCSNIQSTIGGGICDGDLALLPEVAQIPDGLILQLGSEQRVGLGQDGDQPEQVAADRCENETGHDHPPVGSFGHQERGDDAHQPPQRGEADHRQGERVGHHGSCWQDGEARRDEGSVPFLPR